MKKYYYDKTKAQNQHMYCLGIDIDVNTIDNYVIYEAEKPFSGYPIIEDNKLRSATMKELVNLGVVTLKEGQKIEDNKIVFINPPNYYYKWNTEKFIWEIDESLLRDGDYLENGILKTEIPSQDFIYPIWDNKKHIWKEGATNNQIVSYYYSEYLKLNNIRDREKLKTKDLLDELDDFLNKCEVYLYNAYTNASILPEFDLPMPDPMLEDYYANYKIIKETLKLQ